MPTIAFTDDMEGGMLEAIDCVESKAPADGCIVRPFNTANVLREML